MRKIAAFLFAVFFLLLGVSCSKMPEQEQKTQTIEISPKGEAAKQQDVAVTLYYGNITEEYLIGETRLLSLPVNESMEVLVLQELIKGPSLQTGEMSALINPNTRVVQTSATGDVLTVTLSKEFLEWNTSEDNITDLKKQLATYSIINTLVEATGYSRVQILIDKDGNGTGQRITFIDIGLTSMGDNIVGSLERKGSFILTPGNTLELIFQEMKLNNYAGTYPYIAYSDENGTLKPDEATFISEMQKNMPSIASYALRDIVFSNDGQSVIAMVDYTIRFSNGKPKVKSNVPVKLVKEEHIWKLQYSTFYQLFYSEEDEL